MAVGGAGEGPDMNEPTGRRDDTSLQGMVTTTTAVREVEEGEEDVAMRAVLPRLSDAAVSAFNLAFLIVTETAATP
ncbi:hypothetical protein BDBG_17423 [Blastomyces gilchristii SLH14081]|uniref:Uncharacterized protein n=1 Tax=Blastomyces gilchristii (strain SLH14081) TaxID=559298 RepID=A0A179UUM3_BLAGS|nr:uncharacterized protein BDBG_17423 [Blastomyces gilchristii SLH14081]OAT10858.1 hypothetical protein BDBG_17423 [Blastomyces gilchristii SLH14081]